MKKIALVFLLAFIGCDSVNPASNTNEVETVTIVISRTIDWGGILTVWADGQLISYSTLKQIDTVIVDDGALLTSRARYTETYSAYRDTIAFDGLVWELP